MVHELSAVRSPSTSPPSRARADTRRSRTTNTRDWRYKTEQLGGLYIYRNGIRVLPYGDTDYDWLDIEFRRTKGAYYYYFSHRKMFGAVEIDADRNRDLLEKAGREGFQENRAYRQFRSILQNFFLQLAADFFRAEGVHSEAFDLRKAELSREDKATETARKTGFGEKEIVRSQPEHFFRQDSRTTNLDRRPWR